VNIMNNNEVYRLVEGHFETKAEVINLLFFLYNPQVFHNVTAVGIGSTSHIAKDSHLCRRQYSSNMGLQVQVL